MKQRVYVTRLDAVSMITKVHVDAASRDFWLETLLWNAYQKHRSNSCYEEDWPRILPEGCNRINFMLTKLDWYDVEFNVCEVE